MNSQNSQPFPPAEHCGAAATSDSMALSGMIASSFATKPLAAPAKLSSSAFFQGGKLASCRSIVVRPALMPGFSLQVEAMKKVQGKVEVFRIAPHPKYKKRIKTSKKYQAHDPYNSCKVGDTVTLVKCAPVRKTKAFLVREIRAAKVAVRKAAAASELSIPLESAVAPPS